MDLKTDEGVIFKNTKKPEGSKQPDYRGEINCEGTVKEIALWVRKSEKGVSYFSVKLSDPYKKDAEKPESKEEPGDDLPF